MKKAFDQLKVLVFLIAVALLTSCGSVQPVWAGTFGPESPVVLGEGLHSVSSQITEADAKWSATHADAVILKGVPHQLEMMNRLTGWMREVNPKIKIYIYKHWKATYSADIDVFPSVDIWSDIVDGQIRGKPLSAYFQNVANGQPVGGCLPQYSYSQYAFCMNQESPDWQSYFLDKSTDEAQLFRDVDGVMVDDFQNRVYSFDGSYPNAIAQLAQHTATTDVEYILNAGDACKSFWSLGEPLQCRYRGKVATQPADVCGFCADLTDAADGIVDETFLTTYIYAADKCNSFNSPAVIKTQLWQAQYAANKNKVHWVVGRSGEFNFSKSCPEGLLTHDKLFMFNFAGYLLITNGRTTFYYDSAGTDTHFNIYYWKPEWERHKDMYTLPLGQPLENYRTLGSGTSEYYSRKFSNGIVLLNPQSNKVTANLGQSYKTVTGQSVSSTLVLEPHQGLILLGKSNESCNRTKDLTGDGVVDLDDFTVLSQQLFSTGQKSGDLNCDSNVDLDDVSILLVDFNPV